MKGQCRTLMAATHCHSWWMWWWSSDTFMSWQSSQRSLAPPLQLWNVESPRVANDLHVAAPWNTNDLTQVLKSLLLMQADEAANSWSMSYNKVYLTFYTCTPENVTRSLQSRNAAQPNTENSYDSSAGSNFVNHLVSEYLMLQLSLENHLRTALHLGSSIDPL